jgi:hypothetical protein
VKLKVGLDPKISEATLTTSCKVVIGLGSVKCLVEGVVESLIRRVLRRGRERFGQEGKKREGPHRVDRGLLFGWWSGIKQP